MLKYSCFFLDFFITDQVGHPTIKLLFGALRKHEA